MNTESCCFTAFEYCTGNTPVILCNKLPKANKRFRLIILFLGKPRGDFRVIILMVKTNIKGKFQFRQWVTGGCWV